MQRTLPPPTASIVGMAIGKRLPKRDQGRFLMVFAIFFGNELVPVDQATISRKKLRRAFWYYKIFYVLIKSLFWELKH